jgi:hypothetical protein
MRKFDYFLIAIVAIGLVWGVSNGLPVKIRKKRNNKKKVK